MSSISESVVKRAAAFGWWHAVIICLLIYGLASAPGLVLDGKTADDWRQIHGAPAGGMPLNWTTEEGRWLMEVIFVHAFGEKFMPAVQAGLAFMVFFGISAVLARAVIGAPYRAVSAAFLFLLGVHHLYMVNALNFSSHVFAYPLALLLSLGAYAAFRRSAERDLFPALIFMAVGAQAFAFSAAIYQPFAPFGVALLFIAFMRVDEVETPRLVRFFLAAIIGTGLGAVLYALESGIAASLHPHEAVIERVQVTDLPGLVAKLVELPVQFLKVWIGTLHLIPLWMKLLNAAFLGLTGAMVLMAAFTSGRRWTAWLRILIGAAGLAIVLPFFVWLANSSTYFPGRIIAFLGFLWAVLFVVAAGLLSTRWPRGGIVLLVPVIVSAAHVGIAALAWGDQTEQGRRDEALARQVMERVEALEGYDGRPFRVVGGVDYPDLGWGDFLGFTVFHRGNPQPGIFKALFSLDWYAEGGLFDAPLPCTSFPEDGSVYLHDGVAYACLESVDGFASAIHCTESGNTEVGRLCFTRSAVVRYRSACDLVPRGSRIEIETPERGLVTVLEDSDMMGHQSPEGCFYTGEWFGDLPGQMTVSVVELNGEVSWQDDLQIGSNP